MDVGKLPLLIPQCNGYMKYGTRWSFSCSCNKYCDLIDQKEILSIDSTRKRLIRHLKIHGLEYEAKFSCLYPWIQI